MNIHQLPVEAALDSLRSTADGLTSAEAARRLDQFGANRIEPAARVPESVRFLREFTHFFAMVLWIAALLALLLEREERCLGAAARARPQEHRSHLPLGSQVALLGCYEEFSGALHAIARELSGCLPL